MSSINWEIIMAILTTIQLAQRISKLSRITVSTGSKVRRRFIKRHGFWEKCEHDGYAVYYGVPMDDREVVNYVSGGDYVIFAR